MSEYRPSLTEPDNHNHSYHSHELRNSREYSYAELNANKDFLFTTLSNTSPSDLNQKSKTIKIPTEQEKLAKEKKKLEKDNNLLIENIKKLEATNESLRKENLKLRANYEKSEYQRNGFSTVLQKLNEESKQKGEQIKKQAEQIKKLESQLLMGSLHHNLYEENKKLKDNIKSLEEDNREKSEKIMELSERLVKTSRDIDMYKSAAEVNLIEINEHLESNKLNMKELTSFPDSKQRLDKLENENSHLREMLSENSKSVDSLTKEIENYKASIDSYEAEINSYNQALEENEKQIQDLRKSNDEGLQREKMLKEQFKELEEKFFQEKILFEKGTIEKDEEFLQRYKVLEQDFTELRREFDKAIEQNEKLRSSNAELEDYIENAHRRVEDAEKEMQKILSKGDAEKLQEELDARNRVLKERTMQLEQLINKMKGYERDMKELCNKNMKQEDTIIRYQEALDFSQNFIQTMEQKFYKVLSEDQGNKTLKVEIHRLIESCIKRMIHP